MRKLKGFLVSVTVIEDLLKHGINDDAWLDAVVPEDAILRSAFFDPLRHSFVMVYEHESFEAIGEAAEIPLVYGMV